jgi:tRNA-uridine 2-sulfurtransferase
MSKPLIIVAMSGGVDSSVAAYLLKEQGFRVEGLFMKNWEEDDTEEYCSAKQDLYDAQAVCDKLDIKLHTVNFSAEYWENVFERFLKEYNASRTPNPDIWCNREIKFKVFLDYAYSLGAQQMATGHYARITKKSEKYQLLKGVDAQKDQSYFLYALQQYQLSASLFPVGELEKTEVRSIAAAQGFLNSHKKDSTGICFIGERKFSNFLSKYIAPKPGKIRTYEGKEIGEHQGLMYYTLGQRQGIGIGGVKAQAELPWFVVGKDLEKNHLIVAQGHEHPALWKHHLVCQELSFIDPAMDFTSVDCQAKVRYRQVDSPCQVTGSPDTELTVDFQEAQWAITPGQSIVFYQKDICLGGGIIQYAF